MCLSRENCFINTLNIDKYNILPLHNKKNNNNLFHNIVSKLLRLYIRARMTIFRSSQIFNKFQIL